MECGEPWDRGRPARMLSQLAPFEVMRAGRPRSQGRRTPNYFSGVLSLEHYHHTESESRDGN